MARPGEPKTSPRRLLARQRQSKALALRLEGAEYAEIAAKVGYASGAGAFAAVEAAMKDDRRAHVADELSMNLRRLNRLLLAWWPRAIGLTPEGNPIPPDLAASAEVRAILGERARLVGIYPQPGSRRQERLDEDLLRKEAERVARATGFSVEEVMAEALGIFEEERR